MLTDSGYAEGQLQRFPHSALCHRRFAVELRFILWNNICVLRGMNAMTRARLFFRRICFRPPQSGQFAANFARRWFCACCSLFGLSLCPSVSCEFLFQFCCPSVSCEFLILFCCFEWFIQTQSSVFIQGVQIVHWLSSTSSPGHSRASGWLLDDGFNLCLSDQFSLPRVVEDHWKPEVALLADDLSNRSGCLHMCMQTKNMVLRNKETQWRVMTGIKSKRFLLTHALVNRSVSTLKKTSQASFSSCECGMHALSSNLQKTRCHCEGVSTSWEKVLWSTHWFNGVLSVSQEMVPFVDWQQSHQTFDEFFRQVQLFWRQRLQILQNEVPGSIHQNPVVVLELGAFLGRQVHHAVGHETEVLCHGRMRGFLEKCLEGTSNNLITGGCADQSSVLAAVRGSFQDELPGDWCYKRSESWSQQGLLNTDAHFRGAFSVNPGQRRHSFVVVHFCVGSLVCRPVGPQEEWWTKQFLVRFSVRFGWRVGNLGDWHDCVRWFRWGDLLVSARWRPK